MQRKIHLKRTASFSTIALLILTLVTAFYAPKAHAEVLITQISPSEGPVGTVVTVTGQITTLNGSYRVFFANKEVQNGTATETNVSTTFTVPNSTFGLQLIELHDVTANENSTIEKSFLVQTRYSIEALTPSSPQQAQEGANITIIASITGGNFTTRVNITVTDPANIVHSATNISIQIAPDGYGAANRTYPNSTSFDQNPHTYYVGSYRMKLNMAGETQATGSFTIGLTNATEYHRFQTVFIQAANYTTADLLTVKVTHINETFELPSSNASGPLGIVTANWTISANASLGIYTVEVENLKPLGYEKPVQETQNFTIVSKSFTCQVRTLNLDGETVEGVLIEAWNATTPAVKSNTTRANGTVLLSLEATDYTFKAFRNVSDEPEFKEAQVGETAWISLGAPPGDRLGIHTINLTCSLAHINVTVKDTAGAAVPLAEVRLSFTYTNRLDKPSPSPLIPLSLETNLMGQVVFRNMYTNINYNITGARYGAVFASKQAVNLTKTTSLDIECPTYTLVIKVEDRNGAVLQDAQVEVYEWSMGLSGLVGKASTGSSGEATFNSTFGKYFVDVYKNNLLVNRTIALLIDPTTEFLVHCKLYSLTLEVKVIDYFGLGIPNANVTIEREGAVLSSSNTGSNGVAQFTDLVGGNYRILVYVGDKPYEITPMYLQEPQIVAIKMADLVSIGGFITETSRFLTATLIILFIIAFLGVFLYRRVRAKQQME